jgi:hypothetical protein
MERRISHVHTLVEQSPTNQRRVSSTHALVEYTPSNERRVSSTFVYVETTEPGPRKVSSVFVYVEHDGGRPIIEMCGVEFIGRGTQDGMGDPLFSDRSAWDTAKNPEHHARDIDEGAFLYHLPNADTAGQIPVWDGSKWVVVSRLTNPMTSYGDMIWGGADGAFSRLAIGADGQVLTFVAGRPQWSDPPA